MATNEEPLMITSDEKLWAMLAHLLGLLGYVSAVGQYIAPLVIFVLYRDKSKFVAFHALQSLFFQLALLALGTIGVIVSLLTCGLGFLVFAPLAGIVAVGALAYVIVAAIRANQGEWFEYWLVGKWAKQQLGL